MNPFGGARARYTRESAKLDVMLILLLKSLHILAVLVAEFLGAVTVKPHSVETLGKKILNCLFAGDIGTSALTILRNFVVYPRRTDGISVKRNHS